MRVVFFLCRASVCLGVGLVGGGVFGWCGGVGVEKRLVTLGIVPFHSGIQLNVLSRATYYADLNYCLLSR